MAPCEQAVNNVERSIGGYEQQILEAVSLFFPCAIFSSGLKPEDRGSPHACLVEW